MGGYAKYIATREGVEKIDDSNKYLPATEKQKKLISKILKDFPDSKGLFEYEDYLKDKTGLSASEFISRALEENTLLMLRSKTYADYIATRPRAERIGTHGLFTSDGVVVNLNKVSEELNLHKVNIWTAIISIRREDASRLDFDNAQSWRDMLRAQEQNLSEQLKIPREHLRWYAAFHNESHHPHVHLIAYSTIENEGYLTPKGVNNLRSAFAKEIFQEDYVMTLENKTVQRDMLRQESKNTVAKIVENINKNNFSNPVLENKLTKLSALLKNAKGKKVYAYLEPDVKKLVDDIVDELAKDQRIAKLYDLWYEQREALIKFYSDEFPERVPISKNEEFRSTKNSVIREALKINTHEQSSVIIRIKREKFRREYSPSNAVISLVSNLANLIKDDYDQEFDEAMYDVDSRLKEEVRKKKQGLMYE